QINESNEELFFRRHLGNNSSSYEDRSKNYYNLGDNPSILQKTKNFFQKMENRINQAAQIGKTQVRQNRSSRIHGGPDTGFEILFGALSVVPNVLKRVFGPTKYDFTKKSPSEDKVDLEFMRHTNEDFSQNELPNIKTEDQLADHIGDLYNRGDVVMGQVPVLDDIARNRVNLYYQHQENPSNPIFQTNNA
ncbi:MAG: hypothetical protein EBS19_11630, partial [Spirochaetia bacterium]|nr:hypothetical protein [Spirochaetia bacterium]